MRRTIFAQSNRVVREDVNGLQLHQRREADGGTHIVREHQKRAAVRNDAAVQRHPVHDRAHRVFTHTKMEVALAWCGG